MPASDREIMKQPPKRAFKGVWIPKPIWDSEEISWQNKCLLAEIDSLDDGSGCYASNDYLAKRFSSTPGSIKQIISMLRKGGWIKDIEIGVNGKKSRRIAVTYRQWALTLPSTAIDPTVNGHLRLEGVPYKGEIPERYQRDIPSPPASVPSPHQEFIALWMECYEAHFERKYVFDGGKDGTAAKALLKSATSDEIIEIATRAWSADKFNCKQADTIAGLRSRWNQICNELNPKNSKKLNIPSAPKIAEHVGGSYGFDENGKKILLAPAIPWDNEDIPLEGEGAVPEAVSRM